MLDILKRHESSLADAISGRAPDRDEMCLRIIKANSRITPQLALEIYRNNTHGARVYALEQIYPACTSILGETTFRSIAREYVIKDTAGRADLNVYGHTFNQHLEHLLAAGRIPGDYTYLPDLASLECIYNNAYFADNDPSFDFDEFAQRTTNGADIFFKLSQSLGRIASAYPIYQIWLNNRYLHDNKQVQAIPEAQHLVAYRDNYKPAVAPVRQCEYKLLDALSKQCSLQQLIDHSGCDVVNILPKLIAQKWIVGISSHG